MSETQFDSVWDALEDTPAAAANMKARAGIMIAIQAEIDRWHVNRVDAARRLGITQPRLGDLLRGRIDRFSLDDLTTLAHAADLTIAWQITPRAA